MSFGYIYRCSLYKGKHKKALQKPIEGSPAAIDCAMPLRLYM
jgi:hypothetical protein